MLVTFYVHFTSINVAVPNVTAALSYFPQFVDQSSLHQIKYAYAGAVSTLHPLGVGK